MTFDNYQISGRQCRRSLLTELFGISIFLMTAAFTALYGRNSFVMFLVGSLGSLLVGCYYWNLSKNQTLSYGKQVAAYSKMGFLVALLYTFRFTFRAGFLLSVFYRLMEKYLISEADYWYLTVPMIVVSAYGAMKGREKRLRCMELLSWFVFVPFVLAMLLLVKEVDISRLKQNAVTDALWYQKAMGWFIPVSLFSNIEFILFLAPKIKKQDRGIKNLLVPFVLAVVCNLAVMIIVTGVAGYETSAYLEQPLIRVLQSVNFPGSFVRRLDILILAFWIFAVFGALSGCIFYSGRVLRDNCCYLSRRTYYPWELLFVMVMVYVFSVWCHKMQDAFSVYIWYSVFLDLPLGLLLAWMTTKRCRNIK